MSTDSQNSARPLPERPNLRHLKAQARDLLEAGAATSVTDAQFRVARQYGFASWPKLKAHVESLERSGGTAEMPQEWAVATRATRESLITAIMTFLAGEDLLTRDEIRSALEDEIDRAGPQALIHLKERLATASTDWAFYPADPLARHIHHILADRLLQKDSALIGTEHIASAGGTPLVICANHLSYADANLLQILLHRSGAARLADRLTAIAGPKVFTDRVRRFSSLCFGTIRTPQSANLSTAEVVMSAREVAHAARRSLDAAYERLSSGDVLLVFGEGTRSRTRGMQQMLVGVARYVERPGTWILPVGIVGPGNLFPIDDEALHPVRVVVRIGKPVEATALAASVHDNRRLMMDAIGLAIAELLPAEYRGVYGNNTAALEGARRALAHARQSD
jgi:1-acyl-sn-glycerol-3-phosphate acyltransferase